MQVGSFDAQGYLHGNYNYRVLAEKGDVLGPEWNLDNFYKREGMLVQKDAKEYLTTFTFDPDGDGTYDQSEKAFLYDLRYKHKQRDAVIWLRTVPISSDLREKDLRVLMQQYVDEVAGAGYEAVSIHPGTVILSEKRFAASVVERGPAKLAKVDAFVATVDVANIDQIKLTPGQYSTRVRLVLVRTPFRYLGAPTTKAADPQEYPVLLLAGYANLPEDFEKDLPAFTKFLNRIQIREQRGLTNLALEPVKKADPAAPATSPEPATVATPAADPTPATSPEPAPSVTPTPAK